MLKISGLKLVPKKSYESMNKSKKYQKLVKKCNYFVASQNLDIFLVGITFCLEAIKIIFTNKLSTLFAELRCFSPRLFSILSSLVRADRTGSSFWMFARAKMFSSQSCFICVDLLLTGDIIIIYVNQRLH